MLLSNGTGGFLVEATPFAPADLPYSVFARTPYDQKFYYGHALSAVGDLNGDGLPDVVEVNPVPEAPPRFLAYIHAGKAPEKVVAILEGNGRKVAFSYEAASTENASFYTSDPATSCNTNPNRLACLNHGRWLARTMEVGGGEIPAPIATSFTYKNGIFDKKGRGFLGFTQRSVRGPGSRAVNHTYDPLTTTTAGSKYTYPFAMQPLSTRSEVVTNDTRNHRTATESRTLTAAWKSNGTYTVVPSQVETFVSDCSGVQWNGTCQGAASQRLLGSTKIGLTFDTYGNLTQQITTYKDGAGAVLQTDTDAFGYQAADTANWLVALPDPAKPNTRKSVVGADTVIRTTKLTPDLTVNATTGLKLGVVSKVEVEPSGSSSVWLQRTFGRNGRGQLTSVSEKEVATSITRTTTWDYVDGADGVYVGTTTNALGHTRKDWRHPGLGLLVEADDENNLAATASYDTFGRPLVTTSISGATTASSYGDSSGNGIDVSVKRLGLARAETTHYDSLGRVTTQDTPVDAARSVTKVNTFDALGRIETTTVTSGPTPINTYQYGYDDIGRPTISCHVTPNWEQGCKRNVYDGLSVTTFDETNREVTNAIDAMGRLVTQTATLQGQTTDAIFKYGPFGLLKKENTSDGTGQTDFSYDQLGRRTTVTRMLAGSRGTTYNAFGDVTETYKLTGMTKVDKLVYGRDALGRMTSMTGGTVSRTVYWDKTAAGASQPYALGKLVDLYDGTSGANSKVHFNYNGVGLLKDESWTLAINGPLTARGTASYGYDSQGRLSLLTYPKNLSGSYSAFAAQYTYDPYLGAVTSIADAANPTVPLWKATERNELGQVTNELLVTEGGTQLNKLNQYQLPTGALVQARLESGAAATEMYYAYLANGMTTGMMGFGGGGFWAYAFDYDNLGRLISWTPDDPGQAVTYKYDSDGNLMQRSWPGETVTYANTATARTVTVVRGGTTVRTDTYAMDQWGLTSSTPAVNLSYNTADQVDVVVEKANGFQPDKMVFDGAGNRVATAYGQSTGSPYLLTLMGGLYEFRSGTTPEERYRLRGDGGRVIGDVVRTSATGPKTSTYYLTDVVGSVLAEASNNGTLTDRARRDPYGNLVADVFAPTLPTDPAGTNPDGTSRLGFGDHARDANWGLVDMRARLYSPALGRFISPDSVIGKAFDRRAYNPYAYAWNNPTMLNDPSGHTTEDPGRTPPPDVSSPPSGGGGPGNTPDGSDCVSNCDHPHDDPGKHQNSPYVGLTGTVSSGGLSSPTATSVNGGLRAIGPTDGTRDEPDWREDPLAFMQFWGLPNDRPLSWTEELEVWWKEGNQLPFGYMSSDLPFSQNMRGGFDQGLEMAVWGGIMGVATPSISHGDPPPGFGGGGRTRIVIGLGLDEDLFRHQGQAITYKNGGWQQAGLTKIDRWKASVDNYTFQRSFEQTVQKADAIRFDVTSYVVGHPQSNLTAWEVNYILANEGLLQKTTFIRNGSEVFWNGAQFADP